MNPQTQHGYTAFMHTKLSRVQDASGLHDGTTYCFPGTFLVPFVIEPVVTIIAPLKLAEWVVRGHPEIIGHQADMLPRSFPMDLGR